MHAYTSTMTEHTNACNTRAGLSIRSERQKLKRIQQKLFKKKNSLMSVFIHIFCDCFGWFCSCCYCCWLLFFSFTLRVHAIFLSFSTCMFAVELSIWFQIFRIYSLFFMQWTKNEIQISQTYDVPKRYSIFLFILCFAVLIVSFLFLFQHLFSFVFYSLFVCHCLNLVLSAIRSQQ